MSKFEKWLEKALNVVTDKTGLYPDQILLSLTGFLVGFIVGALLLL